MITALMIAFFVISLLLIGLVGSALEDLAGGYTVGRGRAYLIAVIASVDALVAVLAALFHAVQGGF